MRPVAAVIGGGVIGGGWLARFLLNGWDVQVFDPDPEADRKLAEVLGNARRSLPGLYDTALPPEGEWRLCATVEEAVAGASWIQESVPERLDLKHRVLTQIQAVIPADVVIGSSTSGFKPSELGAGIPRPAQVMVVHPFNPVYLLPVVEVVPHTSATDAFVTGAMQTMRALGMMPLRIRREIDAHVADRFLEAVWREALWLVKDDIATTTEIDDVIRFGFGIRWAQMGLFETYRVAGGEAGMRHFIAQFGPCLSWPWTRLTDVPELDEALIDKIASQSDAQSGMHSIRELERIRAAGGYVNDVGRVNGNLNLSRSLGDLKYKTNARLAPHEQVISGHPDVVRSELTPQDDFFVLACDGVFDVMANQRLVDFVRTRLRTLARGLREHRQHQQPYHTPRLSSVIEELFDECLCDDPSTAQGMGADNMSTVLVLLRPLASFADEGEHGDEDEEEDGASAGASARVRATT